MSGEADQVKWRGVRPISGIRGIWPDVDAVRAHARAYQSGTGSLIAYTVPSGKILFISTYFFSSRLSVDGSDYGFIGVRDASDVVQFVMIYHYYDFKGQLATTAPFAPALEALAGWDVFIQSYDVNLDVNGGFFGWLEDA